MSDVRIAVVNGLTASTEVIEQYLPNNYLAEYVPYANIIVISGIDNAGWTLDGYVIPRLASGNYYAKEIQW